MTACALALLAVGLVWQSAAGQPEEHYVDIGVEGDEAVVGPGVYQREGPVPDQPPDSPFSTTFRWAADVFTLDLPVFPGRSNLVTLGLAAFGSAEVLVEVDERPLAILREIEKWQYDLELPGDVVGDRDVIPMTFRASVTVYPTERDPRILFALADWVRVRPCLLEPVEGEGYDTDIGAPGDEVVLGPGFYGPEGPYVKFGDFFRRSFRWAQPGFQLTVPVFPNSDNTVVLDGMLSGEDTKLVVRADGHILAELPHQTSPRYHIPVPADVISNRRWLLLTFGTDQFESANPADPRKLFCAVTAVHVRGAGEGRPFGRLRIARGGPEATLSRVEGRPLASDIPPMHNLGAASDLGSRLGRGEELPAVLISAQADFAHPNCKLPAQVCQEAAVLLAHGCRPKLWALDREGLPPDFDRLQEELEGFVKRRVELLRGSSAVPMVALVEPGAWRVLDMPGHEAEAVRGAAALLRRLHYPADIVTDREAVSALSTYAVVVLPGVPWVADRSPRAYDLIAALPEFVRSGGGLVVEAAALLRRTDSGPRELALADLLGVAFQNRGIGSPWAPAGDYYANLGSAMLLALDGAEMLLPLYDAERTDQRTLEAPALTLHRVGSGGAVCISADLFAAYARRPDPRFAVVAEAALSAAFGEKTLQVSAPGTVEVCLRHRGGTTHVHLVNCTQTMDAGWGPQYVQEVLPVGPVTVRLRSPERPKSVRAEPGGERLQWSWEGGWLQVGVPRLDVHTAVVLEAAR